MPRKPLDFENGLIPLEEQQANPTTPNQHDAEGEAKQRRP